MLIGRETELALIEELLEDARRGGSRVLVITGEAGIGKSALLAHARERASGMQTLAVAAVESEADLPFAALLGLLRPVLNLVDRIPERQGTALAGALALEPAEETDRLAANAGTLNLLAEAASEQPLLVLVDDAHWLDRASAEAIAFAARRVGGEDLAFLAAIREGEASAFDHRGLPEHRLMRLNEEESLALVHDRHGSDLDPTVARTIVEVSAGNPLALVELPATLSSDQLGGREPLEEPIPVAERIQRSFLRRVRVLDEQAQRSLLVAAAAGDAPLAAVRSAAAALDGGPLDAAEDAGLIALGHGEVTFRHPLLRSAIYESASPGERRAAHRALADALTAAPDERAWHLAAAAEGPDEAIAAALEEAAERAVERGGYAARARALERAAELSPDPAERARRLSAAALAAFWSGDTWHAVALCERTLPLVDDPLVRADLVHQYATAAAWLEHVPTLPDLGSEASRVEDLDADRACKLLVTHATHLMSHLEYAAVLAVASRLEGLVERLGPWWRPRARTIIADARIAAGETAAANDMYDALVVTDPIVAATTEALVHLERYDDARRVFTEALEYGRSEGNILRIAYSQTVLAVLELALGHLERARTHASNALELMRGAGIAALIAENLLALATIDALQGRQESCRARVAEAATKAPDRGFDAARLRAHLVLGLLESSLGRYEDAIRELETVHDRIRRSGQGEPSVFPYQPDLVEAYARLGRLDEAVAVLDWFERQAEDAGRRWALAAAARCRGLLAGSNDIDGAFARALNLHDDVPSAFERARTELVYGERLRRANRRRDARSYLRAALERFDEVGAEPWSARAHSELRATGEHVPRREPDEREHLTPQELQIATLVAEGKTNREIGAQIFLSPKTVEFHLTRVYRKLDIHSRAELIKLFAGRELAEVSSDYSFG